MDKKTVMWQYCKNPNDINDAIMDSDPDWEGLESAEQIISITYDTNYGCYVVFWKTSYEGTENNP